MAQTAELSLPATVARRSFASPVTLVRLGIVVTIAAMWEALAASGLLFQDVVPSILHVLTSLGRLLLEGAFYANLAVTGIEVLAAMAIGVVSGIAVGILLGGSRFLSGAYENVLYYFGPTPKIIFFPVMIMWFGVGIGSKIAMGSLSCFFPVALSTAAGMRGIERVLINVGRSFRASTWQMVTKVYLPAMRAPILNGLRLGFGFATIGVLLAETKLSNQGLGFMIIQSYTRFDMPRMYAMLIAIFAIAAVANALLGRLAGTDPAGRS